MSKTYLFCEHSMPLRMLHKSENVKEEDWSSWSSLFVKHVMMAMQDKYEIRDPDKN